MDTGDVRSMLTWT